MLLLQEKALFGGQLVEIELHDNGRYLLRYGDLVEYINGRKTIRKKNQAYDFRSVEKLRYDFERDVEAVGGKLG